MIETFKIRSVDELIAVIPHTFGFTPASSMVCVPLGGSGPTIRVDLPLSHDEFGPWIEERTDEYLDLHYPARVALVAYGEDQRASMALDALGSALRRAGGGGAVVSPVLWVNGEEWVEVLSGTAGKVDASIRGRIDAEFALRGRVMPAASREDLAKGMKGDPSAVAQLLPAARQRFGDLDGIAMGAESAWLGKRLDRFRRDREYLSDRAAARALVAIGDPAIRDAAVLSMKREDAPVFSELWQDLVRRAPAEVRDGPATLLALTFFLEGRGAQAWLALDELAEPNEMGNLLAAALTRATDPRQWDKTQGAAVAGALMQRSALGESAQLQRRPEPPAQIGVQPTASKPSATNPDAPGPGAPGPGAPGPTLGR